VEIKKVEVIRSGVPASGILLHGFGQRYDLPASLALYLYAAAGVVVISFVLVVVFSSDQVGSRAVRYPRRAVPLLAHIEHTRLRRHHRNPILGSSSDPTIRLDR
jgi:hypothetical protein